MALRLECLFFFCMRFIAPRSVSLFVITLTVPFLAAAASVADVLTTPDTASVTRGDFLKAAADLLEIPKVGQDVLMIFGKDVPLQKNITRGEAVRVLVGLQKLEPDYTMDGKFRDVPKGSALADAVQVALEKGWLTAQRANVFGANKILNGKEARTLLRRVVGESIPEADQVKAKVPTVVVRFKTQKTNPLPNEEMMRSLWQLITDHYVHTEKITPQEASYKAMEAMVNSLNDPYTNFLRPVTAKDYKDQLEGEISGIGAQVEMKDNIVTVVAPISGSPAEKAGVQGGDQIVKIDGTSILGLTLLDAVAKIRGPKGTSVVLTLRRNGAEFDVSVTRDTIKIPEITISYQGTVAVIKLAQFGATTDRELGSLLTDIAAKKPTGILLDLRNNPGGFLHTADVVVGNFLPQGSIVAKIVARDGETLEKTVDAPTIDKNVPMVVLVNKGSASASEIVAGALQDAKRAKIVGEQTFGKGTVQQIFDFRDGSTLKVTIAEWLTPTGRAINGTGITPDIVVPTVQGRDEQLLKALELLR